ncbi:MAG: Ferric uptake regulation protein Fur2 [Parcubacteria group bacterium GW2011_GWE2_39_37]|uniref:Ferric uptake regulation protein Fur2 n=1 Tax=Candidatus Falkowbacteria bacterium GW2011_GWF2_39_8 TaxID=1618642 RepID=A0A0G0SES9_9BACT|nr:MAG: Ferric uptake regulation protein Fur2 [Parcubacteria group bacterium GW2011_GWE2_39_37]KKR33220.1 MAG: Ferric uptake regulation protein Fur2 [Candidatus Falkowbacteria bacterium GW2011_GWF2_39_8]
MPLQQIFFYGKLMQQCCNNMKNINGILNEIRRGGNRMTKARNALVELFYKEKTPIASAEILAKLAAKNIVVNRTTVYRELRFLLEQNIIIRSKLPDHRSFYELSALHRHHLICTRCKKIKGIVLNKHLEDQEKNIYKKEKFKVISHSLEFYGLCGKCLKSAA